MQIRPAIPADRDTLLDVWLRSVRATHAFVSEEDLQSMIPQVRDYLATDRTEFLVLREDAGPIMGFMGLAESTLEALFLAPEFLRRGGGRKLVEFARARRGTLRVDVNEQNSAARSFYEACGFVVEGRSELDEQGRPYPLLHMRSQDGAIPMATPKTTRPEPTEYVSAYGDYIKLVGETDILQALGDELEVTMSTLRDVSEPVAETRHAPYTWSIKEVLGHLIDAERIFAARALRFARGDATPLPGFDENEYVRNAHFDDFPLAELVDEFANLRIANIGLFRHLREDDWSRTGIANGNPISVRALAYILVGHERHHMSIIRRRLGKG